MLEDRAGAAAAIADALDSGRGASLLVLGDAGIGKSTLVAGAVDAARSRAIPVVMTRWSGDPDSPPLWSWTVLTRNWLESVGPRDRLAEAHPLVRRLVPEEATALGLDLPEVAGDERSGAFATGDGLGRMCSRGGPTLIVLEDLHHAAAGGLGFLESFVAAATTGPVVVLATSRDLASASGLTAHPATQRIMLGPLHGDAAAALVRALAPDLDDAAVLEVVDRADGNPFFLSELARLAASGDTTASTTPAVRDVVMRRVEGVGERARDVLATAALLGRKPPVDLLYRTIDDDAVCDQVLDDAEAARLIELDGPVVRWNHDLVRESLTESLRSQEARRLHARIADAIAHEAFPDSFALAHHVLASGATTPEAADLGEAAAAAANDAGAREECLVWIGRVAAITERLADSATRARRLDLMAGTALIALSRHTEAKQHLVRCAERSLQEADPTMAAHALLMIGGERLSGDDQLTPPDHLIDHALQVVEDEQLRIRLLGRKADFILDDAEAFAVGHEATLAARAGGYTDLVIRMLLRELINWHAADPAAHDRIYDEVVPLAEHVTGEQKFEIQALQVVVLLERGDVEAAAALVPVINAGVLRLGLPSGVAFDVTIALIDLLQGRFDEADELVASLLAAAPPEMQLELIAGQAAFDGIARILRGEVGDFLERAQFFLSITEYPLARQRVHSFIALGAAVSGDRTAAEASLDEIFRFGLDRLHQLHYGYASVIGVMVAEAACLLGQTERAALAEEFLEPYAGRVSIGGMAPALSFGAFDHARAMCARVRGDLIEARARIDAAVALHEKMGAVPFIARSRLLSAEIAVDEGDSERIVADARQAATLAARLDMSIVTERAATLLAAQGAAPVRGARVSGSATAIVFTDIESSTATAAALGDAAWMERLREHDTTVRKLVAQHGGREIKHLGDGFMLAFATARAAVEFCRELHPSFAASVIRVRAGIHSGPVTEEDGDVFGTTVNIAARVSASALAGETLITDDVLALLPDASVGEPRSATLKGVDGVVRLHPLT